MIALIQRVSSASVVVDSATVSSINKGLLVFLGVEKGDSEEDIDYLLRKVSHLRIFEDEDGKLNHSVRDINGEILVVSQFTLLADCRKGNRPSFERAESPERAKELYELFIEKLRLSGIPVASGIFGASMKINLINDGPVTIIIDSKR
ncbi:MAG: D-aminoacyl-tRNA deacylase [Thermodesulfovibrionales bacterium]|nr:D-aminoacyl-tRNA deacylase [Thermodesulfovibrionales bacterium]